MSWCRGLQYDRLRTIRTRSPYVVSLHCASRRIYVPPWYGGKAHALIEAITQTINLFECAIEFGAPTFVQYPIAQGEVSFMAGMQFTLAQAGSAGFARDQRCAPAFRPAVTSIVYHWDHPFRRLSDLIGLNASRHRYNVWVYPKRCVQGIARIPDGTR